MATPAIASMNHYTRAYCVYTGVALRFYLGQFAEGRPACDKTFKICNDILRADSRVYGDLGETWVVLDEKLSALVNASGMKAKTVARVVATYNVRADTNSRVRTASY